MLKTNDAKQIAIYSRKSKFTGKGESIENQIELCKSYISLHFENVKSDDIVVYEDEGFSGGNLERPQLKLLMKAARENKLSAVVCYRLDRISRNIGDFAGLITELDELKISFVSIKEQFDTSSPMGRAMMYISSVFSQLERETIAERIRDNMRELAKTGRWLGGMTPTGYKSDPVEKITVDGKAKKAYKLTAIPEEIEIVKTVFSRFCEFNSLTKTEAFLMNAGVKTKNGKWFSRFTIRQMLENPVYMTADTDAYSYFTNKGIYIYSDESAFVGKHGMMVYNKTLQRRGQTTEIRDYEEWIAAVGRHEGVISGKDFVFVQSLLGQNKSKAYRKPKSNVALLSGVLYCKDCGGYMRPKLSKRTNKDGETVYDYMCEMKERSKSGQCRCKNANGNTLDKMVCDEIVKLSHDGSALFQNIEKIKNEIAGKANDFPVQITALQKAFDDNKRKIDTLIKMLSEDGSAAGAYITDEINSLHEKNEALQKQIAELKEISTAKFLADDQVEIIKGVLKSFAATFETLPVEQKRLALRTVVERITWDGETIDLYLLGSGVSEKLFPNGEDSKRNSHAFQAAKENCSGYINERAD